MKYLLLSSLCVLFLSVDICLSQPGSNFQFEHTDLVTSQLLQTHNNDSFAQDSHFRNPWTIHRRISAIGLGSLMLGTLVGSAAMEDEMFATTVIPVVGPFVTMVRIENDPNVDYLPGGKQLLTASGIAQSAFLVYFVTSVIGEYNYRNRQQQAQLSVAPMLNGAGISMNVRF